MVHIDLKKETKEELDAIGREIAQKKQVKSVSYEQIVKELVALYEQVEITKTLKAVPQ